MSEFMSYRDEPEGRRAAIPESHVESWIDDEFFDDLVDIINENFVLEVEASLELRNSVPTAGL